jgi:hypothetical protein
MKQQECKENDMTIFGMYTPQRIMEVFLLLKRNILFLFQISCVIAP